MGVAVDDQLTNVRVNYVWEWWKFHAKQRTDMFNYFLIITGILANAYVAVLKERRFGSVAIVLGIVGIVTAAGFAALDQRNRKQLERSNEILRWIEDRKLPLKILVNAAERDTTLADIKVEGLRWLVTHHGVFLIIEGAIAVSWLCSVIYVCRLESAGIIT